MSMKVLFAALVAFALVTMPALHGLVGLSSDAQAAAAKKKTAKKTPKAGSSKAPKCTCACKSGTVCRSGGSEVSCDSYKTTYCKKNTEKLPSK